MCDRDILQSSCTSLRRLVDEFVRSFEGIPDTDLMHWKPSATHLGGGEMNTFAVLAIHTAEAANWRIVHQVFGLPYNRDRDGEFRAIATGAEMRDALQGVLLRFESLLEHESLPDLLAMPPTIREHTPDWNLGAYLLNTIEHTALHLGHAQITRQLWMAERASQA